MDKSKQAVRVLDRLKALGRTLSVAESCTGGMIGETLTAVSGSSFVFWGGFLLYSNEAKERLAGVSGETLASCGAVSRETVVEMAAGTKERCGTDYALSVSGVAGPDGGSDEKPVGTVWIGLAHPGGTEGRHYHFAGDRGAVREQTTAEALALLLNHINNNLE